MGLAGVGWGQVPISNAAECRASIPTRPPTPYDPPSGIHRQVGLAGPRCATGVARDGGGSLSGLAGAFMLGEILLPVLLSIRSHFGSRPPTPFSFLRRRGRRRARFDVACLAASGGQKFESVIRSLLPIRFLGVLSVFVSASLTLRASYRMPQLPRLRVIGKTKWAVKSAGPDFTSRFIVNP